jgi:hypothetical protein
MNGKKPKIPKCVYANWKYCWQRVGNSIFVREYGIPDEKQCAACLAAHVNWGDGATRRPLTKNEMLLEIGKLKLEKCANCGEMRIIVENGRCQKCQDIANGTD